MRKRVRAKGALRPNFSAKLPAVRPGNPRSCRTWHRDLQSGTAFAALFAIGLIGAVPAARADQPILPTGGQTTHGAATISGGNGLLIEQTSGSAIISWETFSIGAGGATHFSNGSGATLNRVTGNVSSQIDGSLTATGSLFLVNPAGVVVGTGGMVATGGTFAASTHDVSDADFLDGGDTVFAGDSKAQIINQGTISSAMGDVALIARRVENTGDISAPNGTAALLAGYEVLMHETTGPNGKFAVRVGGADTEAVNSGTINAAEVELRANGGNVLALAGNTRGVIKATGVSKRGGRIFLTAGGGKVQAGGRISARRRVSSGGSAESGGDVFINADTVVASANIDVSGFDAAGGNIDIGGRDIALTGATLDASGTTGGGRIRVGGEYQGGKGLVKDEVQNAETLLIDAASVLRADGTGDGADGGTVIAWSDGTTTFDGRISVRGAGAGDGGFVETSGAYLGLGGRVDVASALGESGTWLIDPVDVTVDAVLIASILPTLEAGGNITVTTNNPGGDAGDISLISALTVDFANDASADDEATITAFANNTITVGAAITALNGVLNLNATGTNGITINAAVDTNGGDVTMLADSFAINAAVDAGAGTIMFNRVTVGNLGLGFNAGAGTATLNTTELGQLTAGALVIGDPTAAQNRINQLDLQGTFDLSGNIAGLVQLNALSSASAFVTSVGSHTFHSVEFNANDGVTYTGDETVTTTVGGMTYNVDANSGGGGGFNDLRAQSGDVVITTAADLLVTTQKLSETGGGTLSLNAAGNITIARSTSGAIGVGDGASGGLSISDAQLGRMAAASLTIGDATNTTMITVDGGNWVGLGDLTLTTTETGAAQFADGTENYSFGSLTVNAGTTIIGADITTTGAQAYNGAVALSNDSVLTSTGGGNIGFSSTTDGAHDLTVNTAGNATFADKVGGTAPLDNLTTDAGGTTFVNGGLVATTGSQTFNDQVSVAGTVFASTAGSLNFNAGATTTLPNNDVWFLAADDLSFGGSAQWAGTGNMTLVAGWNAATDGSTGWTLGDTTADTSILDNVGNYGLGTGDISIGTSTQTTGISVGSRDGTTTALAQNLYIVSSNADDGYAQLGFRGAATGDIDVKLTEDLTTLTLSGLRAYVQLGHGGHNDDNDHSGDISIEAGENVFFGAGGGTQAYAQLGHGGYDSDGNHSGAIDMTVEGSLTVAGGVGADAYAQIGHGDTSGNASGTRMGDISAIVGGQTSFTANTGGYWFGHATTTDGGISNADVVLVTNGLSVTGGDFAGMIRNNLTGGDLTIVNRRAQIADDSVLTDDIIYDGAATDGEVVTEHTLTLVARGEVTFEKSLQMEGSGNINLVAGWNGTTGLGLVGNPVAMLAAIALNPNAYGNSTGDNGDVNIREFNTTNEIAVGTWNGDINVLAHDLEVHGGDDFAFSQLGVHASGTVDIDSNIRIVVRDDVSVIGGDGRRAHAAIGHTINDGEGPIAGNIVILGENAANDNVIEVVGGMGTGSDSYAKIGHTGAPGDATTGAIFIRGEDIAVVGGDADDNFAQIGHSAPVFDDTFALTWGRIDIEASNDLEVLGGTDNDAYAQIGHNATLAIGRVNVTVGDDLDVVGGTDDDAYAQIGHNGALALGRIFATIGDDLAVVGGDDDFTYAQIGHTGELAAGRVTVETGGDALLLGGFDDVADAQIGHDFGILSYGDISFDVGGNLIMAALTEDALAYVGHSGDRAAIGDIAVTAGDSLIMGTLGPDTAAQIGHFAEELNRGDIGVDAGGTVFLGNVGFGSYTKIGHGNLDTNGPISGDIDVTAGGPIMFYGGLFGTSFTQFGHGDPFGFSAGTREGDINVTTDGELSIDDGAGGGSLSWIGHGTATAGGVSNANVFLQAFAFDRDILSTVAAGGLGTINKDIIEADIPAGNFTMIATGTGIEFDDPVYNSAFQFLAQANNDIVLNTNATFTNTGTGDIIMAAGGDFHNDTGSLTPFTTGGRWLVYSTRPDNNRNDVEVTNWDFLRYATNFDINNPHVGSGDGFVYSVAPVVNFTVSSETIAYGQTISPTITQILTVNGIQVDANAFGLGINPATAQYALASFVTLDASGNPVTGFYGSGLTTGNESIPYFGMSFTTTPGDLTVTPVTTVVDGDNPITTATNSGIGGMCAFRSDDEDPDEDGPSYDRIIELCGIIESNKD